MKTFTLILAVLMLVPAIPFASSLCESEYSCMTGKKDKNHQHTYIYEGDELPDDRSDSHYLHL